jgi:signal transduction histidine kinase
VRFYDDRMRGEPVRMAVLLQPVAGVDGQGMATIQVAETLELRRTLARQLLVDTLWQQALLWRDRAVVVWVVQRATQPVRDLSAPAGRAEDDLSPLDAAGAPRELQPVIEATNTVMARLAGLLEHQKRFVRDASHQLRTPLAVLKAQVQSARRGDVAPTRRCRRSTPRSTAPPSWPTRCWRWPRSSSCVSRASPVVDCRTGAARRGAGPGAADRRRQLDFDLQTGAAHRARARMVAARADAQPAAQRHQAHAAGRACWHPAAAARDEAVLTSTTAAPASPDLQRSACSSPSPPATRAAARAWAWPSAWRSCAPPVATSSLDNRVERPRSAWMRRCACRWRTIQP